MKTQLKLHTRFEECEAEDLTRHHRIQGRCHLAVFDLNNQLLGHTEGMEKSILERVVAAAEQLDFWDERPVTIDVEGCTALAHRYGEKRFIEVAQAPVQSTLPSHISIPGLSNNIYRFCQEACKLIRDALDYDRVMVYRFHPDYSGEIIAEECSSDLEPFIGLHYPATDIPSQARALYRLNEARIIYTAIDEDNLITLPNEVPLDQTFVSCRGVSPYHLQYLANMGSQSTASVAIKVEGKLWGLVSLHRQNAPTPDLRLLPLLRTLSNQLSQAVSEVLILEEENRHRRAAQLLERFKLQLEEEFDIVPALLMSGHAIHRLVGGIGAVLIAGDTTTEVGNAPGSQISHAIMQRHISTGDQIFFCSDMSNLPPELYEPGIGGYAYIHLGVNPPAGLIVYRREVSQSVAWGGDPRREAINPDGEQPVQYTPRGSFSRWVETVEGRSIEWDESARETVRRIATTLASRFGGGSIDSLGLLLAYSASQLVSSRDKFRVRLLEQFERVQQAIAIALEDDSSHTPRVLGINEAAAQAFNIPEREAENMPLQNFSDLTSLPLDGLGIQETRQLSVWTHDRGNRDLEVKVERLFEFRDKGRAQSMRIRIFYLSDITESRRVELALQAAYMRSQRQAAAQNQIIAQLMHELRTPLNSIIGFSSFLTNPKITGEQKSEFLERIVQNAQMLQTIIQTNDQQSRAMSQQLSDERVNLDLNEATTGIVGDLSMTASESGISLELEHPQNPVCANIVPGAFNQIAINLISNAIKYSNAGNSVTVRIGLDAGNAFLEVADTGIGMTEEELEHCTVPFKRFTERPGSGLGLSIVKQLTEANDGVLDIRSVHGEGTQIRAIFPAALGG